MARVRAPVFPGRPARPRVLPAAGDRVVRARRPLARDRAARPPLHQPAAARRGRLPGVPAAAPARPPRWRRARRRPRVRGAPGARVGCRVDPGAHRPAARRRGARRMAVLRARVGARTMAQSRRPRGRPARRPAVEGVGDRAAVRVRRPRAGRRSYAVAPPGRALAARRLGRRVRRVFHRARARPRPGHRCGGGVARARGGERVAVPHQPGQARVPHQAVGAGDARGHPAVAGHCRRSRAARRVVRARRPAAAARVRARLLRRLRRPQPARVDAAGAREQALPAGDRDRRRGVRDGARGPRARARRRWPPARPSS